MKICIACNKNKSLSDFPQHKGFSDGLRSTCKECYNNEQKSNPERFFRKIYATQCVSSQKRKHPAPSYTLLDLMIWADKQPNLCKIWYEYQKSNYDKNLAPSIDRLDSSLPYSLANIELVTWAVNNSRGWSDTKSGNKITRHKAVRALNLDDTLYRDYISIHAASRDTGAAVTNIQRIADKTVITKPDGRTTVLKTSKGFKWEWL